MSDIIQFRTPIFDIEDSSKFDPMIYTVEEMSKVFFDLYTEYSDEIISAEAVIELSTLFVKAHEVLAAELEQQGISMDLK